MKCLACGQENRAGARYCDGCGAALVPVCPHCGAEIRPTAHFCDACGHALTDATQPADVSRLTLEETFAKYQIIEPIDDAADREQWQDQAARDVIGG